MSIITWNYVKKLQDEDIIDSFLIKNKIELPVDAINLIKLYNGGRPSKKIFNTRQHKERVFKALLSYNTEDKENIYISYSIDLKNKGLYPIASDPAGNFICIDLKDDNKVVLYEHENSSKEYISSNVSEMLDMLYN